MKKVLFILLLLVTVVFAESVVFAETARDYYNLGQKAKKEYRMKDAIKYWTLAGEKLKEAGRNDIYAIMLSNIGEVYRAWGQYDKAIEHYKKALAINQELSKKDQIAVQLNNIGMVYKALGQYDKAIEHYKKALAINEELGIKVHIAANLNNIGIVYKAWGQYDKAIEHYKKALAIDEELDKKGDMASDLNNIGMVYYSWGHYDKAMEHFKKALPIAKELGQKDKVATRLNNIGMVYYRWGQLDKAIEHYKKALAINEELRKKVHIAGGLNNIGMVYNAWGQYDKAIEHYKKALAIDEELGRKDGIALRLSNIGAAYGDLKIYNTAIEYFNKSVNLIEQLRLTAEGAVRMDYLASQIHTYQLLTSCYIRYNKPDEAFNTVELSSAKYLVEQMGGGLKELDISFEGIKPVQMKLNAKTAIINYANLSWVESAQIVADAKNVNAVEVKKESIIANINKLYKPRITSSLEKLRGIKVTKKETDDKKEDKKNNDFDSIITYYRLLLSKPDLTKEEIDARQFISKELYSFLFSNIEKYITKKNELIIIPDGILAFLPFETLIMPDGRYLIEKYNIKYTQSLGISEIINKRDYSKNRKPLIAFGGAVYDQLSYNTDMIGSAKQLQNLQKETLIAMNRGQSTRAAYASLGLAKWGNLPGTLTEVTAIKNIIPDAKIYTKNSVEESKIKAFSKNGELKNYKVIHFATHGLVVPEMPELSALVLSLFKDEKKNEDGYLRMNEIVALDLNADFVNLSACETGLGKIYGGEGVVGLTQSFLIAGANGLSVSLWQVADESTMKFMIGVYKLVQEKGISYDMAITDMKRAFITGRVGTEKYSAIKGFQVKGKDMPKKINKYSSPFYWAPFVYYGK